MILYPDELAKVQMAHGSIPECLSSAPRVPFNNECINLLAEISDNIFAVEDARVYPDLIAVAFNFRKSNLLKMSENYNSTALLLGRGKVFHITPSNVPLNFVYSWAYSLLAGNANLVRMPSKNFPQVDIFIEILSSIFRNPKYDFFSKSNVFFRYPRSEILNNFFSSNCEARIIWGGDDTIREIRKSELPIRSVDLAFSNRYSFSLIDAKELNDANEETFEKLIDKFFSDAYLFDQMGCSSPKLVCWFGEFNDVENAKLKFWSKLRVLAAKRYDLQQVSAVTKFVETCKLIAVDEYIRSVDVSDNFVTEIGVDLHSSSIGAFQGTFGTFIECSISDLQQLSSFVNEKFQTITYFGFELEDLRDEFSRLNLRGVDRVVPVGQAFDITLTWDGLNFIQALTRIIDVR